MCNPLALFAAATVGSTAIQYTQARKQSKAQKAEAARLKAEAIQKKSKEDGALRETRKTELGEQGRFRPSSWFSGSATVGPRTFFAGA